ncbi:MAG TPA: FxSxx-COOH cyclophane-containing RiPP peptide [Actinophytocola sp.]|uniref:FxSxx-COOH cyclophane-containing RiPP peptide n=1 Tax=Actinophytocola sp. TaxID=1872138 RepID=UPI002DDCDDD7|nr:FxSxx-COOH cyclophane-containing RiPP peptide [Actinophytocola sp.]HEV2783687.1 FxSxx-COOH cyclophane-containing RiPP peptide [Actinophytocola sp.]
MEADDIVLESELLDVTGVEFDQLDALPDSVLRAALHRVLTESGDSPHLYASFENSL